MKRNYLESAVKQFEYYKMLGEKTFAQIPDEKLFWQYNEDSNSIATIVKHLWGNMLSRWTSFLTTDGEKEWRNRDAEFENDIATKQELIEKWNEGWTVFFDTIKSLKEEDLEKIIYIRNQGHTVLEAINRQLAHYPYHIGQIVFIGKLSAEHWQSLSIPKGNSKLYNENKFSKPKEKGHFTDEYLSGKNLIEIQANKNKPDYFIVNATEDDFSTICRLFEEAILFQKRNNYVGWSSYDNDYLKADIQNGLLFKMIKDGQIISIFSICHTDVLIWREREKGNSVYLHRIVLNQVFKGEKVFRKILDWAIEFSKKNNLKHIRMDTWADNDKIIEYYKSYGFKYVETYRTPDTNNLPLQHRNLTVTMLEFTL